MTIMQHPAEHSPLGKSTGYATRYDASLLFGIERRVKWEELGLASGRCRNTGVDLGGPSESPGFWRPARRAVEVLILEFRQAWPFMVSQNSLSLSLTTFNQTCFSA